MKDEISVSATVDSPDKAKELLNDLEALKEKYSVTSHVLIVNQEVL